MSPVQGVAQHKATAEHCKGVLRDEESHEAEGTGALSKKTQNKTRATRGQGDSATEKKNFSLSAPELIDY